MQRGSLSNVVFIGIVGSVAESQLWQTGSGVTRTTQIACGDWGAWFTDFNWSPLTYLAISNGQLESSIIGTPAAGAIPNTLFSGNQSINPAQIAYNWFVGIMGGSSGVLAQTQVRYGNQTYMWPQVTTGFFEEYPLPGTVFPVASWFISEAGNWYSKFTEILEDPYYEVIVGTAPYGAWNPTSQVTSVGQYSTSIAVATEYGLTPGTVALNNGGTAWEWPGIAFSSIGLPNAIPAYPQIVGRINPLPDLGLTTSMQAVQGLQDQQAYTFSGATKTRWANLTNFVLSSGVGFIQSTSSLDLQDYYNFFVLNPLAVKPILTLSNSPGVFMYAYSGAANVAGIRRYGFKSMVRDSAWMINSSYQSSKSLITASTQLLFAELTTRLATYYTPLTVMENAQVELQLFPNIFVGNTFTYSPFRNDVTWTFYINAVTHTWNFGGPSTTVLGLERGLPTVVYGNTQVLGQVLLGNAMRASGYVTSGLPANAGPPLQTFGLASDNMRTILGEIARVYASPGAQ